MKSFHTAGIIRTHAKHATPRTQESGTLLTATRLHSWCAGPGASRENANIMRDAEVTEAVTQKNCATTHMKSRNSAQRWLIDVAQIQGTIGRSALTVLSASGVLGIANVTATRRTKPKMTDTKTEVHMPTATSRDALWVSSAVWADASKPVIVYWAMRSPRPNTNQNAGFEKDTVDPPKPELFTRSVKT